MKLARLKILLVTFGFVILCQGVNAAEYGTLVFPSGISPSGFPQWTSYTYSLTTTSDADDIVALSLYAEATAPSDPTFCITSLYPSNILNAVNPPGGILLDISGLWIQYCTGIYFVCEIME